MLRIPSCRCWIWCEEDDRGSRIRSILFHASAAVDHELKERDSRIQYKSQKELQEANQILRRTPSSRSQLKYRLWRPSLTKPDLKYPYKFVLIWLKSEIGFFLHSRDPTNPSSSYNDGYGLLEGIIFIYFDATTKKKAATIRENNQAEIKKYSFAASQGITCSSFQSCHHRLLSTYINFDCW